MATPPLPDAVIQQAAEAYKRLGYDGYSLVGCSSSAFGSRVRTAIERGFVKRDDRRTLPPEPPATDKSPEPAVTKLPPYKPQPQPTDRPLKILMLPDVQAKPGHDFSYLMRIGTYMVEKRPDVVVCIGDFADMESLSSYDKGKKQFEGRRYRRDVEAAHEAMAAFLNPLQDHNEKHPDDPYRPRLVLTLGNHEFRINRLVEMQPEFDGDKSVDDLKYKEFGWEVHPFLEVVVIAGVAFSHYFVTGVAGRAASTAAAQLRKTNMSTVAGHQQGKQIAYATRADGSTITSIIAGSCYEHDEDYLGPQGNKHWRGCVMLHEVREGRFDEMWLSLDYMNSRYAHISLPRDFAKNPVGAGETAEVQ
jgi:hypothetical protein